MNSKAIGALLIQIMLIINNCTNIFSQSCDIYILLVEQVTTDYDGSSCFALGFSFVFFLHSNMLKYGLLGGPAFHSLSAA